jgi:hypothetical protein
MNDIPIIGRKPDSSKIEICRSFSYKVNAGNHGGQQYESADFFCSRKMECSTEDAAWVSQSIYEECVHEVRAAVAEFIADLGRKRSRRAS